jgi:hypothetical protein
MASKSRRAAQAKAADRGPPNMASGVDRAGAGATENRLDPRLESCRVFGQTDPGRTAPASAALFRPAIPGIWG